jgi:hypothetical protein
MFKNTKSLDGMERGQLGKEHDLFYWFGIFFFIAPQNLWDQVIDCQSCTMKSIEGDTYLVHASIKKYPVH